jgi:hypothetical protein
MRVVLGLRAHPRASNEDEDGNCDETLNGSKASRHCGNYRRNPTHRASARRGCPSRPLRHRNRWQSSDRRGRCRFSACWCGRRANDEGIVLSFATSRRACRRVTFPFRLTVPLNGGRLVATVSHAAHSRAEIFTSRRGEGNAEVTSSSLVRSTNFPQQFRDVCRHCGVTIDRVFALCPTCAQPRQVQRVHLPQLGRMRVALQHAMLCGCNDRPSPH